MHVGACAALVWGSPAAAQHDSHRGQAPEFLASARAATERYHDLAAAIADGYRMVGTETPDMGQHWVHPVRVLDGLVDPSRPAILVYTVIQSRPALAGVAYAVPIEPGGTPPEEPVGRAAWHTHWERLDVENLRASHDAAFAERERPQIAVLHAWVWIENPAGPFEPSNWALPFVQVGVPVPHSPPPSAARMLALGTIGPDFLAEQLGVLAGSTGTERLAVREVLAPASTGVRRWLAGRGSEALTQGELAWLCGAWAALRSAIGEAIGADDESAVRALWGPDQVP